MEQIELHKCLRHTGIPHINLGDSGQMRDSKILRTKPRDKWESHRDKETKEKVQPTPRAYLKFCWAQNCDAQDIQSDRIQAKRERRQEGKGNGHRRNTNQKKKKNTNQKANGKPRRCDGNTFFAAMDFM